MFYRAYHSILLVLFRLLKSYFVIGLIFALLTSFILILERLFSPNIFNDTIESGIDTFELNPNNKYSKVYVIFILFISALVFWPIVIYALFNGNDEDD